MFTVSVPAEARLAALLKAKADDAVVRIIRRNSRLRLRLGLVRPDDRVFAHEGRVVLAFDERLGKSLSKRQLDVRTTEKGPRLRLVSNS